MVCYYYYYYYLGYLEELAEVLFSSFLVNWQTVWSLLTFVTSALSQRDMNITIPRKRITSSWGMRLRNWSLGTRNGESGISITMDKVSFTGQGQVCCLTCADFPFCAVLMLSESFGISWCINKLLTGMNSEETYLI